MSREILGHMSSAPDPYVGTSPEGIPIYLLPADEAPRGVVVRRLERPKPGSTLLASAQRLRGRNISRQLNATKSSDHGWQQDAWDIYDLVGEQRFLVTTLAGRLAQARIFVGSTSPETSDRPEPHDDERLQKMLADLGGGSYARLGQHIYRMAVGLLVAGEGWLAGIPKNLVDGSAEPSGVPLRAIDPLAAEPLSADDLDSFEWHVLSTDEIRQLDGDRLQMTLQSGQQVECSPSEAFLVRIWRPHPRKAWLADSPTRSSLPVLRELVGLTQHISAQIDSRLAGAGVLLVPASAAAAMREKRGEGESPDENDSDPFTDALIDAMITPISDRDAASAIVPLVVTVPDGTSEHFKHLSFDSPLDEEARELRDEAIRRLALGQDAPPELLLGSSGMNHWGAWLVREDVVTTHLEPLLALICDALTQQYLRPIMEANGYREEEIRRTVIWYDVDHMIVQPTRAADAERMHDKGLISDEALRDIAGFDESAAPEREVDPAVKLALDLVRSTPSLMSEPGLSALVEQIRAVTTRGLAPTSAPAAPAPSTEGGIPQTGGTNDEPEVAR